ncbi:MAG: hypothetical protein HOF74_08735 [Gammaproteobacteria bacterium]|jgi:uncharacterized protein YpmS|nr:hypothetical protein [Gammaproteobacteria bacterium]MBT3859901.1 hypothetical protein [Gammaproteobacteria bacterium]MBT3986363.1 hypothetical protein [Gammaproteobacteria bacterium]MBT4254696.1 hypothetical protein [Gammaproteobacteria bacterium]MBT4582923.1 hypothetical protein [Gammaproteobacteria bacterium]
MTAQTSNLLRHFLRAFLVLLVSAPIVILLLSVQTAPSVSIEQSISPAEISRIERLLLENAPESPGSEQQQEIHLDSEELNLLLRYALEITNQTPQWAAQLALESQQLTGEISLNLFASSLPLFLNIRGEFASTDKLLELQSLQIGKLTIPQRFLDYTINRLKQNLLSPDSGYGDFNELLSNVNSVKLTDQSVDVSLRWDPELATRIGNQAQLLFISEQDQRRIRNYYQQISDIAVTIPSDIRAVSISSFLVPLFATAAENAAAGSDPIAENRTLFQTLAIYVNQESISQLLGEEQASQISPAKFIEVRLQRRQDLAQHLISIAAITASAGADLAELVSTTKEAYDARYRSGFSFSDLTANSVGVAMARLATSSKESALLMQQRMKEIESENDYMPEVGSNRDGLSESDFNAIYEDRNSPEYQQRLAEIKQLIGDRPLFSGLTI